MRTPAGEVLAGGWARSRQSAGSRRRRASAGDQLVRASLEDRPRRDAERRAGRNGRSQASWPGAGGRGSGPRRLPRSDPVLGQQTQHIRPGRRAWRSWPCGKRLPRRRIAEKRRGERNGVCQRERAANRGGAITTCSPRRSGQDWVARRGEIRGPDHCGGRLGAQCQRRRLCQPGGLASSDRDYLDHMIERTCFPPRHAIRCAQCAIAS